MKEGTDRSGKEMKCRIFVVQDREKRAIMIHKNVIFFKNKETMVVGTPLRSILREAHDRSMAIANFGLRADKKTIFV